MEKIKEMFFKQKESLNYFFDHLDYQEVEKTIDLIFNAKTVFFTGVGKSGFVAEQLSVMMVSVGIRALYLPVINAVHGELGIVEKGSLIIFISKSGESAELLQLVPYSRNKGAKTMAWTSNRKSSLAQEVDYNINIPLDKELCPFNLAPVTSSVLQLLFGNTLTISLMKKKNFTLDSYAKNHPSGKIGRRLSLRVKDLMIKGSSIPLCQDEDSLKDVLIELSDKRCGCLLILNKEKKLKGIFTDGDLRRALYLKGKEALDDKISKYTTKLPKLVSEDLLAFEALNLMERDKTKPVTVLPVINKNKDLVGLLKLHDILQKGI